MNGSFKRKKFLTSIIIIVYQFLTGCEYAIIFPSAWAFLQSLGVTEEYWLGYTLSAYGAALSGKMNADSHSVTILSMGIAGLVGGRLADIYIHQTKSVVLISIAIMAIGNIQYALGIGLWNILCARLLCGVGTAAQSAMIAELCRVTEVKERTPILAVCNAAKQVGIFIGPAFQLLFSYCNFSIFNIFEINPLNAAGAFMGVVWLLFLVAALVMFYNLTAELDAMRKSVAKSAQIKSAQQDVASVEDQSMRESSLKSMEKSGRATFAVYVEEFLTDTFVLLQSMVFSISYSIMAIETVIPMVMQEYFDCTVLEISLLFMGAGLAALMIYSTVAFFSNNMRDSSLQLVGYLLFTAAHVWLLVILPLCEQGEPIHIAYFTFGCMLLFLGYPFASIGNNGLTAKVLSGKTQGLGQGVRRLMVCVGLILGPLWGGSMVKHPYWFMGLPLVILVLNGLMLTASFFELRRVEDEMTKVSKEKARDNDEGIGEEEPLLNGSRQF